MGRSAHLQVYNDCKLGGCSAFYDLIIKNFENEDGENYIETHSWKDFLEGNPEVIKEYPEEVKEVEKDLEENGGCVSYAFF